MIKRHPINKDYGADENGTIYSFKEYENGKLLEGYINNHGYRRYNLKGDDIAVSGHRFVWECFNGVITDRSLVIDHINQIRSDNRLSNIRLVTVSVNNRNCKKKNSNGKHKSKYKGVYYSKGKWRAIITIGTYDTEEEARDNFNKWYGLVTNT